MEKIEEEKRKYRTRSRATGTDAIPDKLPVITNGKYFEAMNMRENKTAYIFPIDKEKTKVESTLERSDEITISGGKILIKGRPASVATIKNYFSKERVINIDVVTIKLCYGIILSQFEEAIRKGIEPREVVTVYYPDLAKKMGKAENLGSKDVERLIDDLMQYQDMVGITKGNDVLPLLVFMGYENANNTIKFASPYMNKIIREIYSDSIRKDKAGNAILKGNGLPDTKASYSYLIDSSIASERNKRAVEIVCIIVQTIERSGRRQSHISAKTIVERSVILSESLRKCDKTSNKNVLLKRAFERAFELLRSHTRLIDKYPGIVLPNPHDKKSIPTMATLDLVYEFPIRGLSDDT